MVLLLLKFMFILSLLLLLDKHIPSHLHVLPHSHFCNPLCPVLCCLLGGQLVLRAWSCSGLAQIFMAAVNPWVEWTSDFQVYHSSSSSFYFVFFSYNTQHSHPWTSQTWPCLAPKTIPDEISCFQGCMAIDQAPVLKFFLYPSFMVFSEFWVGIGFDIDASFRDNNSFFFYSQHFDQLWINALADAHHRKKHP